MTRLSYKKIKKRLGLKNVSLAKPEIVRELTESEVGTVSLVQGDATTIVDERLARQRDGFGVWCPSSHAQDTSLRLDPHDGSGRLRLYRAEDGTLAAAKTRRDPRVSARRSINLGAEF